jgi:hypothetical protein
MAVVTVKSTAITNRDASPRVINDGRLERSTVKNATGFAAVTSGDSIASKYILAQIPSTAIVKDVKLTCSAITTCAGDVGLYRPTASDGTAGTVISAAFFSAANSLASALNKSSVMTQTTYTFSKREQPIWQAAGLTSDPGGFLDVAITLTAAAGSAGTVAADVEYMDNGS